MALIIFNKDPSACLNNSFANKDCSQLTYQCRKGNPLWTRAINNVLISLMEWFCKTRSKRRREKNCKLVLCYVEVNSTILSTLFANMLNKHILGSRLMAQILMIHFHSVLRCRWLATQLLILICNHLLPPGKSESSFEVFRNWGTASSQFKSSHFNDFCRLIFRQWVVKR